jgi:hypothetical protein
MLKKANKPYRLYIKENTTMEKEIDFDFSGF